MILINRKEYINNNSNLLIKQFKPIIKLIINKKGKMGNKEMPRKSHKMPQNAKRNTSQAGGPLISSQIHEQVPSNRHQKLQYFNAL